MSKTRSLKKIDLKNWPNISNIRFELTIDFTRDNEKSEDILFHYDKRPRDRIDSTFHKPTPDALDKHQTPYIGPILEI